jgi:hypothetical protein
MILPASSLLDARLCGAGGGLVGLKAVAEACAAAIAETNAAHPAFLQESSDRLRSILDNDAKGEE